MGKWKTADSLIAETTRQAPDIEYWLDKLHKKKKKIRRSNKVNENRLKEIVNRRRECDRFWFGERQTSFQECECDFVRKRSIVNSKRSTTTMQREIKNEENGMTGRSWSRGNDSPTTKAIHGLENANGKVKQRSEGKNESTRTRIVSLFENPKWKLNHGQQQ